MSFRTGKNSYILANQNSVSDVMKSLSSSLTIDSHDVTTFSDGAGMSRSFIPGLITGTLTMEGLQNDGMGQTIIALNGVNNIVWTAIIAQPAQAPAIGDFGYGMLAANTTVDVGAPVDDLVTLSVTAQSNIGLDPIVVLDFQTSLAANGTGSTLDNGAGTTAGGAGYLNVVYVDAGTVTVTLRHSTDNFAADDTELCAFTAVAPGGGGQRVTFTGTVKRYVRAKYVLAGGCAGVACQVAYYRG